MTERRRSTDGRGHRLRLLAYVLVVAIGVVGFHSIDVEAYRRCQAVNNNARAVRELVAFSTRSSTDPLPADTPASVRELVRRGQEQAAQLRAFTETHVLVQHCNRPWPAWNLGKP